MLFRLDLTPEVIFRTTAAAIGMTEEQARVLHGISAIDPRFQHVRATMQNASMKLSRMPPAGRA